MRTVVSPLYLDFMPPKISKMFYERKSNEFLNIKRKISHLALKEISFVIFIVFLSSFFLQVLFLFSLFWMCFRLSATCSLVEQTEKQPDVLANWIHLPCPPAEALSCDWLSWLPGHMQGGVYYPAVI